MPPPCRYSTAGPGEGEAPSRVYQRACRAVPSEAVTEWVATDTSVTGGRCAASAPSSTSTVARRVCQSPAGGGSAPAMAARMGARPSATCGSRDSAMSAGALGVGHVLVDARLGRQPEDPFAEDVAHDLRRPALDGVGHRA